MSESDTYFQELEETFNNLPECMKVSLVCDYIKTDPWLWSVLQFTIEDMDDTPQRRKLENMFGIVRDTP